MSSFSMTAEHGGGWAGRKGKSLVITSKIFSIKLFEFSITAKGVLGTFFCYLGKMIVA